MEDTSGAKILNVDDNEAGRYAITRILQHAGFEVLEASTGEEALNAALEMPDLILLDVNLPDINGFEVCRRLKSNPVTQPIPILHVSATYKDSKSTVNGLEVGADGYLTQPVEPLVLLAHVKTLLRSSRLEQGLRRTNRFLKALSYCNQALLRSEKESDLIQEVCRVLVEVAGHRFVWVGTYEPESSATIHPVASWGDDEGLLELTKASLSRPEEGCCPLGEAVMTGKPIFLQDIRIDSRCEPWRTEALKRGFVSAFALPLFVRGSVWGGISICSDKLGILNEEERELLFQLAQDLAYGIETLRTREEARRAQKELRDSEERYRELVENSFDGIFIQKGTKIVFANSRLYEMLGYNRPELEGVDHWLVYHPDDQALARERAQARLRGEKPPSQYEIRLQRKDGSSFEGEISARPVAVSGEPGIQVWIRDISYRRRAEQALRESEERFRLAFENANIGVCLVDTQGRFIRVNDQMCNILGYSRSELENMAVNDVTYPEDLDLGQTFIERACSGEIDRDEFEKRYVNKKGNVVWGKVASTLVKDSQGNPLYFISHIQDRTQQKLAEDALRESEERYRYIVENIEDLICVHDMQGNLLFVSSGAASLLGFTPADMVGENVRSYLAPEVADQFDAFLVELRNHGRAHGLMLVRSITGEKRLWEYRSKVHSKSDGKQIVIGIARDITERRRALEVERRLVTAIEQASEGVIITDIDGTIQYVNPSLERMTGYSRDELVGQNPRIFKSGEHNKVFYKQLWDTIKAGNTWTGRLTNRRKDGLLYYEDATISPVKDASGKIVNFVAVKRDITEHLELSKQLLHAQKMEAIGTLAGGVAHDFNNILQVALGYSELLLGDVKLSPRHRSELQKINEAARRGADLVQRLLTFSRKTEIRPKPLDLNRHIKEIRKMLERTIPKMIDIQLVLADDLAPINADPTQVDQVLMNLAVNARDAMPEGGKLIIETANVIIDEEYARMHLDSKPGKYVLLIVTDTGKGIDSETLEHIFEPFYTTKGVGKGTGLGLSIVHGIVQHHGGYIRCYSELGWGTTFKIYFPAIAYEEDLKEAPVKGVPRGGSETILLVDDEELVAELGKRILTKAGYTVLTAKNGKDALDIYKDQREKISLVILDLIMPEMGGKQCLQELLQIDPLIKVIIASGYSANGSTKEALDAGAKGFANKPYDIRQLLEIVRKVLDEE